MGCLGQLIMLPFYLVFYALKLYYYFFKFIFDCIKGLVILIVNGIKKINNGSTNITNSKINTNSYYQKAKDYNKDDDVIDAIYEPHFDKEAKLWGLSEKDKIIAKSERMTPADYIEAEERDDDNLDDDD